MLITKPFKICQIVKVSFGNLIYVWIIYEHASFFHFRKKIYRLVLLHLSKIYLCFVYIYYVNNINSNWTMDIPRYCINMCIITEGIVLKYRHNYVYFVKFWGERKEVLKNFKILNLCCTIRKLHDMLKNRITI